MLSLKPLRPTMREKKRYVVYRLESNNLLEMKIAQNKLIKSINEKLGVFDSAKAGIIPIGYDQDSQEGIIRVNFGCVDKIRALFVIIGKLMNNDVAIHTKGVSGILKKAQNNFFSGKLDSRSHSIKKKRGNY